MERRLTTFLVVNLGLTALVVGTLAIALARREPAVVVEEARAEAQAGLESVRDAVMSDFTAVEWDLSRRLGEVTLEPDALRELTRRSPLVRHAFLLDARGQVVHPAEATATASERAFLQRASAILTGRAVMPASSTDEGAPAATVKRGDSLHARAERADHGWLTWYWDDGVQLLFWKRAGQGAVVGVEVERVALLARLVGRLPSTREEARLALVDGAGAAVYVWGAADVDPRVRPLASVALPSPLDAWRLTHTLSVRQTTLRGQARELSMLRVLAPAGMAALLLMGLGVWLWRESRRAMREAAQRVSFVTQVSHELKTPLTNIRLYAELLADDIPEEDPAAGKLAVIVAESQRLSRLINNILTFSRRQRHQLALHRQPVVVDDLVESVVGPFRPSLDQKGVTVEGVLANLVSNVEKYAAAGKSLRVVTTQEDGHTRVTVSDRGPGVGAAHRDRVFDPFYRASDRLTDGVTGTGIGLTIARDLARMHGGDLTLDQTTAGASFTLTIPHAAEKKP